MRLPGRSGTAALEFAIGAMALMTVCIGIMEAGRLFAIQHALAYGVDRAARYAAVHGADSAAPASAARVAAVADAAVAPLLGGSTAPSIAVSFAPDNAPGSVVTVTASAPWTPLTALLPLGVLELTSSTSLPIQN